METQRRKIGVFAVESFHIFYYILIGVGLFALGVSTNFATSYYWGVEIRPGSYADYWGARLYTGYYLWRNLAISLLALAALLYILLMYFDFREPSRTQSKSKNYHLYAGLLLPSVFTFGYPGGPFYSGYVGFSLTGMISPIYNYIFTGWTGASIRIIAYTPLYVPSFIVFALGFLQVVSLRQYEKNRIGLRSFLLPVVASLIFSVLMIGNIVPVSYFVSSYNTQLITITFSVPILTIGILIRAIGVGHAKTESV